MQSNKKYASETVQTVIVTAVKQVTGGNTTFHFSI